MGTRKQCAQLLQERGFPVKHRSLERWSGLTVIYVNGRAMYVPVEVFAEAQRRINQATVIRSGKRTSAETNAALQAA